MEKEENVERKWEKKFLYKSVQVGHNTAIKNSTIECKISPGQYILKTVSKLFPNRVDLDSY